MMGSHRSLFCMMLRHGHVIADHFFDKQELHIDCRRLAIADGSSKLQDRVSSTVGQASYFLAD